MGNIRVIDQNPAGSRLVETQQQLKTGAFSGAGWPHDGQGLTRANLEAEINQRGGVRARRIAEAKVFKADLPAGPGAKAHRVRRSLDSRFGL